MSIFDSKAYQRVSGQQETGLFDWATQNYDNAMAGNPTQYPRQQPISLPNPNANYNARVAAAAQPQVSAPVLGGESPFVSGLAAFGSPGRNDTALNGLTGDDYENYQPPAQLNLPVIDEHTNAYGTADNDLKKAVSNVKPKGKQAKKKQKDIRTKMTKQANTQQAAINAAAGVAPVMAQVPQNRRKEIDIHGNLVQSQINNAAGGAGRFTPEHNQILNLF